MPNNSKPLDAVKHFNKKYPRDQRWKNWLIYKNGAHILSKLIENKLIPQEDMTHANNMLDHMRGSSNA